MGILNQRLYQIGCGITIEQGVAINTDQQIAACRRRAGLKRHRLPLVFCEVNDAQARLFLRQLLQHLCGVVRRTIVDRDNFDMGVALIQRGANGLPGISFLVETRDQD